MTFISQSDPVQFDTLAHLLKHALMIEKDGEQTFILLKDGRLFVGLPDGARVVWEEQDFFES